ncbi:thiolase family protein [Temperatibacter marinus]|uniref:Thiolase family protein n=1 Tax=Temperatibacter marinus TaxID=1456591 RepID=A0AA52EGW9_9PROT|nr:thiolase family protein [Temperatibacter marinus]WND02307.1 thiolase family protein [Temperatibacter marinus]
MTQDNIVIVGMARTPMGGLLGDFSSVAASELGATAIKAAVEQSGIDSSLIDETIMGNCLPAGQGQAPARQAMRSAGIPDSTGAVTINKMCGSGMKAMMQASDSLKAGSNDVVVAGGMESMTRAPHMMEVRQGLKYGSGEMVDHMALDGLTDAYVRKPMGGFAELVAEKYQFTREAQDAYAIESLKRAQKAIAEGSFEGEISPVTISSRRGDVVVNVDEQPGKARLDKIPTLRPAFKKDGTVTAANASSISDGAAALVMMRESDASNKGLTPLARIVSHATHSNEPEWFATAPIPAIEKALSKANWSIDDVDLFEINEAFAVVTMAAMKELALDHDKVNVNGGACALGHPIGASGARIMVTLINALEKRGKKRGLGALCIGGGEATAMCIELV